LKVVWYSAAGTSIELSKDSETYKLLVGMRGFHENPEPSHQVTQAPFQNGADRSLTLYEPREVSLPVMVRGPTYQSLEQNGQYLALALNALLGPGTLIYTREDGKEFFLTCIASGKCPGDPSDETPTSYKTTITLIAHDPFWYSYPIIPTYFGSGAPLQFPFGFPFKFPSTTPEDTITNEGNVAGPVTIQITGAIVNPTISRTYSDKYGTKTTESVSFTLTMIAGEVLTITTGPGNPRITLLHDDGNYDTNPFQYLVADPKFWQLQPGDNEIVLTNVSMGVDTQMIIWHASRFTAV